MGNKVVEPTTIGALAKPKSRSSVILLFLKATDPAPKITPMILTPSRSAEAAKLYPAKEV